MASQNADEGEDKPPVFTLVDRGSGQRYVFPTKSADEATMRLLHNNHDKEFLTVYTDGFRAYGPLDDDESYHREAVIHGDGEYVEGDAHVNTCEGHRRASDAWLSPHRGVSKRQTDSVSQTAPASATNPP